MSVETLAAIVAIALSLTAVALNGLKLWQGVRAERRTATRAQFDFLKEELEVVRCRLLEQRAELNEQEADLDTAKAKIAELETALEAATSRIAELETENKALQAQLTVMKGQNTRLKNQLARIGKLEQQPEGELTDD